MKILSYRTSMPFDNRGPHGNPVLSPPTSKSVVPTNNVPTIEDFLGGKTKMSDILPGGGGDWSPGHDTEKNYREKGDDYKRKERDEQILNDLLRNREKAPESWKVRVDKGTLSFVSFPLAQKYMREHNISYKYLSRVAQSQDNSKASTIADTINKCFLAESIDASAGVKETGSAFCVAPNVFLTCAHVVKKYNKNNLPEKPDISNDIVINLVQNGTRYSAELMAIDFELDLALLKSEVDVVPLQIDTDFQVGEDIIAIGSPHGYENNVSSGTVGSLDRKIYFYEGAPEYMFVDLSIFPGSSGCPIIKESNGQVIGIATLIISEAGGYGLNAALSSKYIEKFMRENL